MSRKRSRALSESTNSEDENVDLLRERPYACYKSNRRFCPHCCQQVSVKTYKAHKRLFFNEKTSSWTLKATANSSSSEDDEQESPPCSELNFGSNSPGSPSSPGDISQLNESDHFEESSDDPCSEPEEEQWNEDEEEVVEDVADESAPEDNAMPSELDTSRQSFIFTKWLCFFLLHLQIFYKLSDGAITCLLSFMKAFFSILGRSCILLAEIARLPSSLYKAKVTFAPKPKIRRYVVCRQCHRLYYLKQCVVGSGANQRGETCPFKAFPSHPHRRMRAACGCLLVKTVELASGKRVFYPYLMYCYLSIESSLQTLFNRPKFHTLCEEWRTRHTENDIYSDVYDGKIWKKFLNYKDKPCLSQPHNLALTMNMDFFQPYKHISYSVGAIYLTVMNLPRTVRYKQENVILVGLIPGPHEPAHDINTFLRPLVDELLQFWEGLDLSIHSFSCKKQVRCALLCVACDLPAGRKVCGFLGHSAKYGCSRCYKEFPGAVGHMDYSGFDREHWILRTGARHREDSLKLRNFTTKAIQLRLESELGCRYSELIRLPYFDAPRMLVVDPMHNLFLGTAKHFLKSVWVQNDIINDRNYELIQERVNSALVPAGIGRIPYKIQSGFASFTADQWKNWVNYFSLIALHDILNGDHMECWQHFVLACRILTLKSLSTNQIIVADALLMQFCKRTERLYHKEVITPNMHMHSHLRSCIEDYGPSHGFWLFAFERYNGILGGTPNNNRSIEVQN